MNIKEYLSQSYRLDKKIESRILELKTLKEMSISISSLNYEIDKIQTSRNIEASFIKSLEKINELSRQIDEEVKVLVELKKQIRETITKVINTDEKMVLTYRYLHNYTWEKIGYLLHADARTVRRWHALALEHCKIPESPINILNMP